MTSTATSPGTSSNVEAVRPPVAEAKPKEPWLSPQLSSYFIAGGVAGAASRTVVSPLERLKIIQQVQSPTAEGRYKGVWASLVRMWKEEGVRGYLRGNGINCLRIIPYSAVQFTSYEQLKKWFTNNGEKELDTATRLSAGALAGVASVCSTYPLDLVRSRLSIATASITVQTTATTAMPTKPALASAYHTSSSAYIPTSPALNHKDLTVWGMSLKVVREEGGIRALYRGIVATAAGVAPYVGINFTAYETLRGIITPPGQSSVPRKLLCGALAGSVSQTITYPFDVLRRKMQVTGMGGAKKYNGALDALRVTLSTEGPKGLYRGLWPNLLKVAPSIATSFFTYELVKEFLLGTS
ncbi:mitochondrial carrier [Daedalea quercina L-15889]|uniref:Mitochondrial carrier n=1 Tax=Daedalea quercina L-15889 TaxID=1314783 RepID=A0A165RQZ4_9APHY|nr:mitochondrial carrier [Daedalea quercina L-15889]